MTAAPEAPCFRRRLCAETRNGLPPGRPFPPFAARYAAPHSRLLRRSRAPATPARPVPRSATLTGSGTMDAGGSANVGEKSLMSTPECPPQLVPKQVTACPSMKSGEKPVIRSAPEVLSRKACVPPGVSSVLTFAWVGRG